MKKRKKRRRKNKKSKVSKALRAVNFLAPDFIYYKKGWGWYLAIILLGLILLGVAIWLRYWLFSVVILLSIVVFIQYSKVKPKSKECRVSKDGVEIEGKFYPLSYFKSFAIHYEESSSHLFLETVPRFRPTFWLHIHNNDLKRVYHILSAVLPEKAPESYLMAKINKWFKF